MIFFPWMYALSFIGLILGWPFWLLDYPWVFGGCLLINTAIFLGVAHCTTSSKLNFWQGLRLLCSAYMSGCANITILYIFFVLLFYYIRMIGATLVGIRKGKTYVENQWLKIIANTQLNAPPQSNTPVVNFGIEHGYPNLKTIQNSIKSLYQHFPSHTIKGFSSSISPTAVSMIYDDDPIIAVQQVAGNIARHLNLPNGSILINFRPSLQHPGQVELTPEDDYLVDLHARYRNDTRDIPAILAHEVTHVFLHRSRLSFPITRDNEILTDTTAVYLGVGWICLNAYRKTAEYSQSMGATTRQIIEEKLGYLTPEEFGYVLGKRSLAFNEKLDEWLTQTARKVYKAGFRKAMADYKKPPLRSCGIGRQILYNWRCWYVQVVSKREKSKESSHEFHGYRFDVSDTIKVVFDCPVCFQKLRVPIKKGNVKVRCSVCETELACKT